MEEIFKRKYVAKGYVTIKGGSISEIELIRFFSTICALKIANVNTVYGAFEILLAKLEVAD